eukprot:UN14485
MKVGMSLRNFVHEMKCSSESRGRSSPESNSVSKVAISCSFHS